MKKLFALAALVLGLAACQTEPEGLDVNVGGEVETTVCVSLPEATRATNSAEGAFANVDLTGDATIRYILKIYQKVGNEYVASEDRQVEYSDGMSVVFPVRLVPNRDYRFVVWADYVKSEADVDYHYNTADLANITLNNTWVAMDETRDAYTATHTEANFTSASDITLKLTRPFAKLRVITTDMEQLNDLNIQPTKATVEYTVEHYNAFNAFAGEVIGDSKNRNIKHENFDIAAYGDNVDNVSKVLFTDYFFANNDVVKFNLTVVDQNGAVIDDTFAFNTDINVKRNHLTTITGDILTDGNNIKVEVEEDFADEYIYIEGDYTLTENMVIDRPLAVRAGAKAVINLNGHDIINNTESEIFGEGEGIIVYGELDIIGNGTVQGSTMAVWARGNAGAVVNIYGGTFLGCEDGFAKGGRSVVYASSGNVVNIYGGKVQALAADKTSYANKTEGVYAALNVADNNGMINVYGGSFYKQNPAAPGTEPSAWNATHPNGFLAEGYASVANGEWFDVVTKDSIAINNVDDFKAALANGQETIAIKGGVTFEGTFSVRSNSTIICYNTENPATIKGRMNIISCSPVFKNINFDRNETDSNAAWNSANGSSNCLQYKAVVMIYGDATNKITFNGCNFYNALGTNKSSITNVACELILENCYLGGLSSSIYSQANIEVKNCVIDYKREYQNVVLSINGRQNDGGKIVFTGNTCVGDDVFVLGQFLSTAAFGNGTYYFNIQNYEGYENMFFNTNRVTNKTFADGSWTF